MQNTVSAIGLGGAALAGLLSFLSPCVLPLVPAWLSYISGASLRELEAGQGRARILARSLAFCLGFSLVFVAGGMAAAQGAALVGGGGKALRMAAGALIALFGLNLVFDFAKFLNYEKRFHPGKPRAGRLAGLAGALLVGMAFAAGWSPCIGPILASILMLAAEEGNAARAAVLLGAYSAGLALPFLAVGLAFDRLKPALEWAKRHGKGVRIGSGVILVALGALMMTGKLALLSRLGG